MTHWIVSCLLIAAATPVYAKEASPKPDFDIPTTHIEVKVVPQDQVPKPELLPEEVKEKTIPKKPTDPMEALQHEVETVRDELRLLQATLDLLINQIMADLRTENEMLRKEIQRLADIQESYGMPDSTKVPRPGIGIIREVLEAQRNQEPDEDAPPNLAEFPGLESEQEAGQEPIVPEEEQGQVPAAPFAFTIVQEWGRSLEMVEELGGETTSLKGMVGIVPPGSRREDIEELGRKFRKEFDAYDNINIEIFDDEEVARQYVETQRSDPAHHVMSISKHAASGRDIILYLGGEKAEEVTP